MEISDMLSSLRNIFNIKAEQIAQYVGEQVKYYYHWESGYRKPKPGNLMKLANLYHVPYDLFLSGDFQNHGYQYSYRQHEHKGKRRFSQPAFTKHHERQKSAWPEIKRKGM